MNNSKSYVIKYFLDSLKNNYIKTIQIQLRKIYKIKNSIASYQDYKIMRINRIYANLFTSLIMEQEFINLKPQKN